MILPLLCTLVHGVLGGVTVSTVAPYDSSTTDVPSNFPNASSLQFTYSQGLAVSYYEYGDPTNPTLIITGGWPVSAETFDDFAADMADRGLHVILYDQRGSGKSAHPWGIWDYSLPNLAEDMGAVIEAAAPNKEVAVFGEAWSPFIASEYCDMHPENGSIGTIFSVGVPSFDLATQSLIDQTKNLVHNQQNLTQVLAQWASISYMGVVSIPVIPEVLVQIGIPQWIADKLLDILKALHAADAGALNNQLGSNIASALTALTKGRNSDTSHGMLKYQWYVFNRLIPGIISGKMYRQYLPVDKLKVWMMNGDNIETKILIDGLGERTPNLNLSYLDGNHYNYKYGESGATIKATILEWMKNK